MNPLIILGCWFGILIVLALLTRWITRSSPVFSKLPAKFEPWENVKVDQVKVLSQSPTLTRAEVWIGGQGYAFEEARFLTGEEITVLAKKFIKEMESQQDEF